MPTTCDDVIWMLDLIAACGGRPILVGGWGIDALLAKQSRDHRDLDVLLDDALIPRVVAALEKAGFVVITDWLPVRVELADYSKDRFIDLHPLFTDGRDGFWQHGLGGGRFDYPVETFTAGTINGRAVGCLTPHKQIDLHVHGHVKVLAGGQEKSSRW